MKRRRTEPFGPKQLAGSEAARRNAALLLESLSGACGPQDAASRMGVALARYYQLEARALQAIVHALEPKPRGRQISPQAQEQRAKAERQRLVRELHRYQALYRGAVKSLGLPPKAESPSDVKGAKRRRRMRKVTRGERLAQGLLARPSEAGPPEGAGGSSEP